MATPPQPAPAAPTMSYHLYGAPATASLCVHWMLLELQQDFELTLLDLAAQQQRGAGYLRLNPGGRVPTLLVDGAPHSECAALLMLLAERHPEAGWAPAPGSSERAAYLQWMVWHSNPLMPALRAWFYPHQPAGASPSKSQLGPDVSAGQSDVAGRGIVQIGFRVVPELTLAVRGSFQGRNINHAGPGLGGSVGYTW